MLGIGAAAAWWLLDLRRRREDRLDRAFSRAKRVERAGTGEQGRPYSVYGERSWNQPAPPED
jgi:hypothetical protein